MTQGRLLALGAAFLAAAAASIQAHAQYQPYGRYQAYGPYQAYGQYPAYPRSQRSPPSYYPATPPSWSYDPYTSGYTACVQCGGN